MTNVTSIVELRRRSGFGIYAVPYRGLRRGKPVRLADGAIAETPTPDERCEAPGGPDEYFEVAAGGGPATVHHANLGLIAARLDFEGVYLMPSGEVAAVYGAEALPIA